MKENCRGLILYVGIIPAWRDGEESRKISVIIAGVPADIRTGHMQNTSKKHFLYRNIHSNFISINRYKQK